MKVVKFIHTPVGYACDAPGINTGEYVSLAEYQALEEALERSYERCGQAMSELEALLKRWNEYQWLFEDMNLDSAPELTQLINDTQETLS